MMKKAGCEDIFLGVESGSQKTLDTLNKGLTVETARRAAKMLREEGVEFTASFIIGFPWETEEDIHETLRFAEEVKAKVTQFHFPIPYPGTELVRQVELHGGEIKPLGWEHYHTATQIIKTKIPEERLYQLYIDGVMLLLPKDLGDLIGF